MELKAEAWRCYCGTPQVSATSLSRGCGTDVLQALGEYFWNEVTERMSTSHNFRVTTDFFPDLKLRSRDRGSHELPSLQLQPHAPLGQRARFPDPRGLELASRAPSNSSRLSVPFKGPCLSGVTEPTPCNGPQLVELQRLLTLSLRLHRPLQPLWPLTIWSWSGTHVLTSCGTSWARSKHSQGSPPA